MSDSAERLADETAPATQPAFDGPATPNAGAPVNATPNGTPTEPQHAPGRAPEPASEPASEPAPERAASPSDDLNAILARQRAAFSADIYPTRQERARRLSALIRAIEQNETRIIEAINADFGNRARTETVSAEIIISIAAAKAARRHLKSWMAPRRVKTPIHLKPAKSRVLPQPLGCVGIISPWNYPVQLALSPLSAALAAGNRVMIKPSELTPATSALLQEMISAAFDETVCTVVTGGVDVGQAFAGLPFDHLLFTGSTAVGRHVYRAAAETMTPVTLELGGKSPAIIDASADLEKAAQSIAFGKMYNAGQTCTAPDYVLVSKDRASEAAEAIAAAARRMYPAIESTDDYTAIISDRHFERLTAMVDKARADGATIIEIGARGPLAGKRKLPLSIVIDPPADSLIMREEIFGPVLPIISITDSAAAIAHINAGDRPLALYWFGDDDAARDHVLSSTISGGVTVNDTLMHVAQENLPFGGVGASGIGAYHGEKGFETFSHMKSVFYQSTLSSSGSLQPPYTDKTHSILRILRKIL